MVATDPKASPPAEPSTNVRFLPAPRPGPRAPDAAWKAWVEQLLHDADCGVVVCVPDRERPVVLLAHRRDLASVAALAAVHGDGPAPPRRALLTLLFTDIAASTEIAERVGDAAWRDLLARHRAIVRAQLAAHGGREVDNAGDGFFATFDAPTAAVRCADAIRAASRAAGLELRAGIHSGECDATGAHTSGIAVHVAARIVEIAGPGEILVSATVRDLVAGSGLAFRDADWHALKGLRESRQLFALAESAAAG